MNVHVINTGTEILLGNVLNTHLTFIARALFPLRLRIERQLTVPDGPAIRDALAESFASADLVFVTGGLGPTTDDITRDVAAEFVGLPLRHDPAVMATIEARFARRKIKMSARVARQADVPEGARVLPNANGTAPGLCLPANVNPAIRSPHLFLLPGPPRELRPMFTESVLPILREVVPAVADFDCRTYKLAGIGESTVEDAVGEQILAIPGIELGYCARPGEVDLRVIGGPAALAAADAIVRERLGSFIYSHDEESDLAEVLVARLVERNETLAVAESCTGGYVANQITNVPGASAIFLAGFVTYANSAKINSLGVDAPLIEQHGAVSREVAAAMAERARVVAGSTHALSTTGIAGPGGGTEAKPVGTVFVALASAGLPTVVKQFSFASDRETFKHLTSQAAFNMLRLRIDGSET